MLTFQEVILRLQHYWGDQGSLIWQPYSEKVGAGTMNPATFLRVLGPEPWNVAYVEPSYRPDDGRYGDNPNRMQMHTQFQVILKPDPGNPQERYLESLAVLGIVRDEHDIRFVEDNWESPALGAWGLGWEVWLDGQEITQFTYFQQAGGVALDTPAVEITYGLERIVMYLQEVHSVWEIAWDDSHTYGEILRDQEIDYCRYDFEQADIKRLQQMYDLFEQEARNALEHKLVVPALDYILRCSHTFNLLDARGTVGVTERAAFFKRMRNLSRQVAEAYLEQRKAASYPWRERGKLKPTMTTTGTPMHLPLHTPPRTSSPEEASPAPFLFEIGTEELPAAHLDTALAQLREFVPESLQASRLSYGKLHIWGTPRRLVVAVDNMHPAQADDVRVVKGPPARIAFDQDGQFTRAAQGFAKAQGVAVETLQVTEINGGQYVIARKYLQGRPATVVLAELLPIWIAKLHFPRAMRWNESGIAFSRPIRWLVALLGATEIAFDYAGVHSGRITRGPRPEGSPEIALASAVDYRGVLESYGVLVSPEKRRDTIQQLAQEQAQTVGGHIHDDPTLLAEVTNLVEVPSALLGSFEARYLTLPQDLLIAVMKKHQRYFPILDARGRIMPHFITIRNGGREHLEKVRRGNEDVIRARYADAAYFYNQDSRHPLEYYVAKLNKLTFQAQLGSMLDKTQRLEQLAPWVGEQLHLSPAAMEHLKRAAHLAKADLATSMVVEMTSLQGIMGREYAQRSGEPLAVAQALAEQYMPTSVNGALPTGAVGIALALTDRLDTLAGLFAVGLTPTSSADPYGLRRAATGIVQILLGHKLHFPIHEALRQAGKYLPITLTEETLTHVSDFIRGRLRVALREAGLAYDVVDAVLDTRGDDPAWAYETAQQLSTWISRENWSLLLDNYARCVRITRTQPRTQLHAEQLQEEAELALYGALLEAESHLTANSTANALLNELQTLVPHIQRFFDEVLVMAETPMLRNARLGLLWRISQLTDGIVNLSKLEGF